ncbi:MAG: hypothetical protein K5Q00_00425 [Gammaproteobacteria bacterium]|nr:hypothetical protein [Gammaproteobacteria bacterium]
MKYFILFSILLCGSVFAATNSTQQNQVNQQLRVQQQQPSNSDSVSISQHARAQRKIDQLPPEQQEQEVAQTRQLRDQPATGQQRSTAQRPSRP